VPDIVAPMDEGRLLPGASTLEAADAAARSRRVIQCVVALMLYQGFTLAILGTGAPWIARSFGLGQSGIARTFAWVSLSAFGALALARMADRVGRRRVVLWSMIGTPLSALGAALSPNVDWLIVSSIFMFAFLGATIASGIVMLAEELAVDDRARGQSYAALAGSFGAGLCILIMPLLAHSIYSWRLLFGISALGIALWPTMLRVVPESRRWERAAAVGVPAGTSFYAVFSPMYRRRSVVILICSLFGATAATATDSWSYFHAVTVVHLSPTITSTLILAGGGIGLAGFGLGAWSSEYFGRVRTVSVMWPIAAMGALWYYWGPPARFAWPALWLGAGFAWRMVMVNGLTVAANSAVTELFPTALRGTIIGWAAITNSLGALAAHSSVALLAGPLGGLSVVVGYLALVGLPGALLYAIFIDETRGMTLEAASGETVPGS
jgi:predicted MFS family arabinose efflux permease